MSKTTQCQNCNLHVPVGKHCIECGGTLPVEALQPESPIQLEMDPEKRKANDKEDLAMMGRFLGGLIVFGLIGWFILGNPFGKTEFTGGSIRVEQDKRDKSNASKWIVQSEYAVRNRLKDAKSAQFKNVRFHRSNNGQSTVCGTVNSKNSFGAYTGFKRYIYKTSTGALLFDDQAVEFAEAWIDRCR